MKILVADFDDTLFTSNYYKNVRLVNEFVNKGNMFIIATGRSLKSVKQDLTLDLNYSYIICNDGGIIYDSDLNIVYRRDIDKSLINGIFSKLKKSPFVGNPVTDTGTEFTYKSPMKINSIAARIINRDGANELIDSLLKKYPIIGYLSATYLNVHDQSVSKGNAVKIICNEIDYDYKDVYAIGDDLNDISMCEICHGFAISKSPDELKDICTGVTEDLEELIKMM